MENPYGNLGLELYFRPNYTLELYVRLTDNTEHSRQQQQSIYLSQVQVKHFTG